ncbi:MAG: HAD-IIB family hydrolase [Deltaproteobacteria bacterium]|nr:HAD-IIB family hydrolase [Deltaproteobacteria bacterium]TLN02357.1 MAG: HAD-IIB family hydrolase [bacterium]
MRTGETIIVFSDLDGTLLDENYSFAAARPALRKMAKSAIPLILCTSKTRKEIEHYRDKIGNSHPFISENGGGIFIPEGYFPDETFLERFSPSSEPGYRVIRLGTPYRDLRKAFAELRAEGFPITGFGDLTLDELAQQTGLSARETLLCKERDFDEPFLFTGSEEVKSALFRAIRDRGLFTTQGVYFHLLGDNDKGKAVQILSEIFRAQYGSIRTVALGDSPNDLPMLESVDIPLVVQRPDGRHHPSLSLPNFDKVEGIGPHGWNSAMLELLTRIEKMP